MTRPARRGLRPRWLVRCYAEDRHLPHVVWSPVDGCRWSTFACPGVFRRGAK